MAPHHEVDYMLADCFFAVGQCVGPSVHLDSAAVAWWRARYREKFLHAMTVSGNSWARVRDRVTAVGRFLGQRVVHHAGADPVITLSAAVNASADVESGCRMNAERERALSAAESLPVARACMKPAAAML